MLPKYGNPRLKFPKGEQRKFLENVFQKSLYSTENLAKVANVSPRTVRDWKREKFNITEKAVNIFCEEFEITPQFQKEVLIHKCEYERLRLCKKGGNSCFKKYGNPSTPEGRRRGGSKTLSILRQRGIIPDFKHFSLPIYKNRKLAEFIGIMLGDGGLTNNQATITLNTEADKDYIEFVNTLGIKLFKDRPTISNRKDCKATNLVFSGIKLVEYLVKIGLEVGDKVKHQVGVPEWIRNSMHYKIACLRGLMDTDGCIAVCTHKYKFKSYTYYNPCFTNASKPILKFVENTLMEIGLHPSVTGRHVWLYNTPEVRKYFEIVGSSNYRLLRFKEDIPNGSGNGLLNHIA